MLSRRVPLPGSVPRRGRRQWPVTGPLGTPPGEAQANSASRAPVTDLGLAAHQVTQRRSPKDRSPAFFLLVKDSPKPHRPLSFPDRVQQGVHVFGNAACRDAQRRQDCLGRILWVAPRSSSLAFCLFHHYLHLRAPWNHHLALYLEDSSSDGAPIGSLGISVHLLICSYVM